MATVINEKSRHAEWSRSALIVGLLTLLSVGSWIGFDLYRAVVKTTLPEVLQSQIQPLEVKVDETLIQNLRSRQQVSEGVLDQVQTTAVTTGEEGVVRPSESVAAVPIEEVTEEEVATSSATATTSGEIKL